jgi:hypothetical protein
VHKKTVVACVITPEGREIRTFGTMTAELLELSDWLLEPGAAAARERVDAQFEAGVDEASVRTRAITLVIIAET